MKYEIYDLLNDDNKYGLTILRMHKKADKGVLINLILKLIVCRNIIIHILFIIISSIGLLTLCNDFIPDDKHLYLSTYLRSYLTPYSFVEKLQLSNLAYIIICLIIYFLCILRLLDIIHLIYRLKSCHITEVYNIRERLIFRITNHIAYIFFSYIVEFLSFIYYIELLPNTFIIKKDLRINKVIHKIILILNSIFILVYNINNYFCLTFVNCPIADELYPFKMKIPKVKLFILILFQNISVLHPFQCYLNEYTIRIWCIVYIIIFLIRYYLLLENFVFYQ